MVSSFSFLWPLCWLILALVRHWSAYTLPLRLCYHCGVLFVSHASCYLRMVRLAPAAPVVEEAGIVNLISPLSTA